MFLTYVYFGELSLWEVEVGSVAWIGTDEIVGSYGVLVDD